MRFNFSRSIIALVFLVAASGLVHAESCGLNTLNGSYAFRTSGTSYGIPFTPDGIPAVWVGEAIFDGSGGGTSFNTGSVGGMIFEDGDNRTSFNYTLRRDCSGTFTAHIGGLGDLHWNIVVSDGGKKILSVIKDPGWVFSGEYSKQ
ncbi:MAG: hypothetical protein ACJ72Z_02120 [Pyrinomonadaceae bacterium]